MPNIFKNFFLTSSVHAPPLTGSYDLGLVILSFVIASFASFAALEIASRLIEKKQGKRLVDLWLPGGALVMGSGIWSMHFIGMMAFELPIPMAYDRSLTFVSWGIPIVFAGTAFFFLKKRGTSLANILSSGCFLGTGVSAMHYTGMAAMQMGDSLRYKPSLFFLSVLVGVAVSIAALWFMAVFSKKTGRESWGLKVCVAFVMGLGVCGMHYTGMAAAVFFPLSPGAAAHAVLDQHFDPQSMALFIAISTLLIIGLALILSMQDRGFATAMEQKNKELLLEIMERKEAEQKLRKLNNAIEQSADAVVITDTQGVIEYANPVVEKITLYSASEMVGNTPRVLKSGQHGPAFYKDLWDTIIQGNIWRGRIINKKKNGELYTEEMTISPVKNEEEKITHFVAIKHDVTEQIRMEERLQDALEKAEQANVAKSEFLANMSHELRTPLNGILGLTQVLLNSELTPDHHKKLDLLKHSGETLLDLVNDILDLSKIESGKFELDKTGFDLMKLLERTAEQHAIVAHDKGLELLVDIGRDVPHFLTGDPLRLRQVIVNLLGNAIKFTEKGEVALVCRLSIDDCQSEKCALHFSVRDTGIGIPKDRQEKIFERFTQADSTTTRKFGGAGLGITISKQLVEMMGGRIWVESEPGLGSTFHFIAQFDMQESQEGMVADSPLTSEEIKGLRVLITDDNSTNRLILSEMLLSWGIKSESAERGEQALEILKNACLEGVPFDLLLLDFNMPGLDGFEVAMKARECAELKDLKIILLSSANQPLSMKLNEVGINGCLMKPAKQSELFNTIFTVMGRRIGLKEETVLRETQPAKESKISLSILLVEDNLVNQEVALSVLGQLGHRVELAHNGKEGVEKWKKGNFDLILMDVQMPIMSGLEATREIRRLEKEERKGDRGQGAGKEGQKGYYDSPPRIPIIAMTARAMSGDKEECLAAGMDGYISKPISMEQLCGKLSMFSALKGESRDAKEEIAAEWAPVCDLTNLRQLLNNNEANIKKILLKFLETTAKNMADLGEAVEANDCEKIYGLAHTIKGAAGQIGAGPFRQIALDMEKMGREGTLDGVKEKHETLKKAYEELKAVIG